MPLTTATEQPFGNLPRQPGRLNDPLQRGYFNFCPSETWTPSVNLYEVEDAYLVCVDLAGVDKDQIEVVANNQTLKIRGTRQVPNPPDYNESQGGKLRMHLMEIDHGNFCREVEMPQDISRDQIKAQHRNGMLWIELPKA